METPIHVGRLVEKIVVRDFRSEVSKEQDIARPDVLVDYRRPELLVQILQTLRSIDSDSGALRPAKRRPGFRAAYAFSPCSCIEGEVKEPRRTKGVGEEEKYNYLHTYIHTYIPCKMSCKEPIFANS